MEDRLRTVRLEGGNLCRYVRWKLIEDHSSILGGNSGEDRGGEYI